MDKRGQTRIKIGFIIFVITLVGLAVLGVPYWVIDRLAILLIVSLIVNPLFSFVFGAWISGFNGDLLKDISFTYEVWGHEFSFTLYGILLVILVLLVKFI